MKYIIFPLAKITKPKVRTIAKKLKLSVANKKDSTEYFLLVIETLKIF
ncbi:MAG: hypothetical protein ACRC8P_01250 [Spiroplasma sp.]